MRELSLDIDRLSQQWRSASPFPFIEIDPFLDEDFARAVASSYPSFDECQQLGLEFASVNEKRKIQICDANKFPPPVSKLNELLASKSFLNQLSQITGIENLIADEELSGGGMHITGPRGRLDVHIDFNTVPEKNWHRRLNILVYLNPEWHPEWGGNVEFWDRDVSQLAHAFAPRLNRCIIFETSEISFHGVSAVTCPEDHTRQSFAAYYYTNEAPPAWSGAHHSTVFKARPSEALRGAVLMPLEKVKYNFGEGARRIAQRVRKHLGI